MRARGSSGGRGSLRTVGDGTAAGVFTARGLVRGRCRAVVIVDGVGFEGAAGLLFFELDLSTSDYFGFTLAVGGLGFFEHVD